MHTVSYPLAGSSSTSMRPQVIRAIRLALLWLFGGLLVLILVLPVLLLFPATAVPLYFSTGLAVVDMALVIAFLRLKRTWRVVAAFFLSVSLVSLVAVWLSQAFALTPPITNAQGIPLPGSIATLETVKLGDSEQWISIRSKDVNKPVLLFLAGGPGGSQLATARHTLGGLEDHFVVVNWEQPGAGKSFAAVDRSTLTPERYITDAHELILYLRQRFEEEKVYVLGESWGSAAGYHAGCSAIPNFSTPLSALVRWWPSSKPTCAAMRLR